MNVTFYHNNLLLLMLKALLHCPTFRATCLATAEAAVLQLPENWVLHLATVSCDLSRKVDCESLERFMHVQAVAKGEHCETSCRSGCYTMQRH